MQVIDARGRDSRAALGLRHNEGTLQNRLRMQRQALSGPGGANPIALHRLGDFPFEDRLADIEVAADPVERVAVLVVRCSLEKDPCDLGPVIRRSDR